MNSIIGSIPAWAGEPLAAVLDEQHHRVYPRVGGGTPFVQFGASRAFGLSPRGRGNLARYTCGRTGYRSIPRVGGGTAESAPTHTWGSGLSPRGRGNPIQNVPVARCLRSIPAWRGNPSRNTDDRHLQGSIPAWAGEPIIPILILCPLRVYPRVGGGTSWSHLGNMQGRGLSPRGRGNHRHRRDPRPADRSIPAWAGEPGPDEPESDRSGSIPAWAGEPPTPSTRARHG